MKYSRNELMEKLYELVVLEIDEQKKNLTIQDDSALNFIAESSKLLLWFDLISKATEKDEPDIKADQDTDAALKAILKILADD